MGQRMLGSYLRKGREEAGLSLDAVSVQTKVPRRTLEALEAERLHELPALVFVRGFVRAYCGVVGIDPLPALELLEEGLTGAAAEAREAGDARQPIYLTPSAVHDHRGLRISHFLLLLVAVALFVAAYILAGSNQGGPDRSAAAGSQPATPVLQAPAPAPAQPAAWPAFAPGPGAGPAPRDAARPDRSAP
jgi:cytoskeleton protein RodZ